MEQIECKRKVFDIIERLGEHSAKVERHGKVFFMKDFSGRKEEFNEFVEKSHKLTVSGVNSPKVYLFDKELMLTFVEYIEGPTALDILVKEDLSDGLIDDLFKQLWYASAEKIALDFRPDMWRIANGKLYYLPFTYQKFSNNDYFIKDQIKYWICTKELVIYAERHEMEMAIDRVPGNEYETNKKMALLTVKHYR